MRTEERYPSIFRSDVDASINTADYAVEGSIQAQTQIKSFLDSPGKSALPYRTAEPNFGLEIDCAIIYARPNGTVIAAR